MKVINIIGHSCSGKTTFISGLVEKLNDLGSVATIKHLGHHQYSLEKGKDTTVFYEHGVTISAGIDPDKTVLVSRTNDLTPVLDLLADQGIEFSVIEGFKTIGLPAVVIGDLESDKVLFRNPTHDEVMSGLDKFPGYDTLHSIEAAVRRAGQEAKTRDRGGNKTSGVPDTGVCATGPTMHNHRVTDQFPQAVMMTISIPANLTEKQSSQGYKTYQKILTGISSEISDQYEQVRVSVGVRNSWNFSVTCEILIAVLAGDFETASRVVAAVHGRIRRKTADMSP